MALTLAEAERYSTNKVYAGIVEEFVRMSVVLQRVPFTEIEGNAWQYLRENAGSSAAFYDPQEVWSEGTATTTQVTVGLKILGGDVDVDNFLKATRSNYTDIEAELIAEKSKRVKFTFLDTFYYGDDSINNKEFDGLHVLVGPTSAQTINQGTGTTGAALAISNLDTLIDTVQDGPPEVLLMPKAIRRRINAYLRANGLHEQNRDDWGNMVQYYNGVPIYVDDSLVMTETVASGDYGVKTGGATGSIFACKFGTDAVFGIQNAGSISVEKIGQLETKDAMRHRIKWYVSMGLGATISLAAIDGITDAAAVS